MRFPDEPIESLSDLINGLKKHLVDINLPIWYRGQANATWKLEPKLLRTTPFPSESHYLNRFKQDAALVLSRKPGSEFEWLFLMQHYGIATRLLDWSESPLVALYFALSDVTQVAEDAALWILLPTELNKISKYKPEFESEIPSFEDEYLINYLPSTIAKERKSNYDPMAAIAPRNSARMQSQLGVFTISHRENIYVDEAGPEPRNHVWKYIIPADAKDNLMKELRLLSFSKFQLFPELESLSENF